MHDEPLTPREVAVELGVTPRTVQRWIADGRLSGIRIGGRFRVPRSALAGVAGLVPAAMTPARPTEIHPIRALLIANRGEIAVRIARTARRLGIRAVGVSTLGERPVDGLDQALTIPSYLDGPALLAAARAAGVDAVHPGYGFLAENPAFAQGVAEAGLAWIGPPPDAIAALGDKAAARGQARALGIPVVPGYDAYDQDDATLEREAARIGWPLLVKPAAGGGGKGMRVVRSASDLGDAISAARREASRAFGDDRLILERFLEDVRHIEVQVLLDEHGNAIHLGERDCSAQRRNQKIVEESPAPSVTAEVRARLGAMALRMASSVGYTGAGTVEFLLADDRSVYFLEMNARLQVEHPVTEAVTGRDLVEDQLRIAEGRALTILQDAVALSGHAIEARIYAEDPEAGFLPATGQIVDLAWPASAQARVDAGVQPGDEVSERFDPLLAKVIVHGPTREVALARLRAALAATRVLGVRTNVRFLRWLVAQPFMTEGEVRTDTLARVALPGPVEPDDPAWRAAARLLLDAGPHRAGPWGGGWRPNAPVMVRLRSGDTERRIELPDSGAPGKGDAEIGEGGGTGTRPAAVLHDARAYVDVEGQSVEFSLAMPPSVEEALQHAAGAEGVAALTAPMPGRVIALRAAEGDRVEAHAALVIIEAMKMEHAVTTPLAGRVTRVAVSEGQQVQRGDLLAEVSG